MRQSGTAALLWLAERLGASALRSVLPYRDAADIFDTPPDVWRSRGLSEAEAERLTDTRGRAGLLERDAEMRAAGIRVVIEGTPDFPAERAAGATLPPLLFVKGIWPPPREAGLAIVGTRKASEYGLDMARRVARLAAARGEVVISGAAAGVDTAAHRGALDAQGYTIAVLGCGLLHVYPAENAALYKDIEVHGALVSQFPPQAYPDRARFPARNAVIAALADRVLIVEGELSSGARYTARFAKNYQREVWALPGDITRSVSALPNQLLGQGAQPLISPDALWKAGVPAAQAELPGFTQPSSAVKATPAAEVRDAFKPRDTAGLSELAAKLWRKVAQGPVSIDDLLLESDASPTAANAALLELELAGWIRQEAGRRYRPA